MFDKIFNKNKDIIDIKLAKLEEENKVNKVFEIKETQKQSTTNKIIDVQKLGLDLIRSNNVKKSLIATGIHNNSFYFAVAGNKTVCVIIDSNKKLYSDVIEKGKYVKKDIRDIYGLNYEYPFEYSLVNKPWSNHSIETFLKNDIKVDIKRVFTDLKDLIESYIYHPDKRVIIYVVIDIISSYLMPIFTTKGITVFYAPPASGKTKLLTLYSLLAFNGMLLGKETSTPALMRFIRQTQGVIIVDNIDRDEAKLISLMNFVDVCYKKGLRELKCIGQNFNLEMFETFSPLVIANIAGLTDKVAITRCNRIELYKTKDKKITSNEIDEINPIFQTIKDNLYIFALNEWKNVKKIYDTLEIEKLTSRDLEKLKPILAIAKMIDEKYVNDIVGYFLERKEKDNIIELSNDWLYLALEFIHGKFERLGLHRFDLKVNDIANELILEGKLSEEQKNNFRQYLGKVFSNNSNFIDMGWSGKNKCYKFDKDKFYKFVEISDYSEYLYLDSPKNFKNSYSSEGSKTNINEFK